MTNSEDMIEKVARAICAENCAFYGEPPCWALDDMDGLSPDCDEPGCRALAVAALAAMSEAKRTDNA